MKTTYGFSRRGPDRVAEELAAVLSKKASFEFKALFDILHANLRDRNQAGGGEEMLRLRAYEKLQNLVRAGIVKKTGKEYRGDVVALRGFLATAAELNAKFAAGIDARKPLVAVAPVEAPKKAPIAKKAPVIAKKPPVAAKKAPAVPKKAVVTAKKVAASSKKTSASPKKATAAPKKAASSKALARSR